MPCGSKSALTARISSTPFLPISSSRKFVFSLPMPCSAAGEPPRDGEDITAAVRSEYIDFLPDGAEGIRAKVKEKSFSAGMLRIALETAVGDEIIASRHGIDSDLVPGAEVTFSFGAQRAVTVEAEDEE